MTPFLYNDVTSSHVWRYFVKQVFEMKHWTEWNHYKPRYWEDKNCWVKIKQTFQSPPRPVIALSR